ncbi:hypothetical protein JL720_22 [Aureococcus anophagefferens]|nr:hypothetical protein JL720_22 [Aureococcus anophagefferens]
MQSDAPGEAEATGGAEATGDAPRADAPTRPPSPPVEVFYGPAAGKRTARGTLAERDGGAGQADQDVALGTDVPHLEVPTQSPSRGVLYGPETHRESIIRAEYARKDGLIAQARAFSRRNTRSARGAYVPDPIVSKGAYRQCVVALGELDVNAEPEPRQVATVRSARFGGECPVCWEAWADEDAPDYPGEIRFCCAKMFCHACWLRLIERFDDHTVERFDSETENFLKLETVFAYMRLAADQGYGDAMRYLGNLYRDGTGVEADADEAQRWHARAAAKGK